MTDLTLGHYLRESETDPFLRAGPPAPEAGWIYRDFRPMPRTLWFELLDLLGQGNVRIVAANPAYLPPNDPCRAQVWISPDAQARWAAYLAAQPQDIT